MGYLEISRENDEKILYHEGDNSYPSHFHRNLEFLYALEDGIEVLIANRSVFLNKGQLLLIDRYVTHHILGKGRSITLCLPLKYCDGYFDYAHNRAPEKIVFCDERGYLSDMIRQFSQFYSYNALLRRSLCDRLLGSVCDLTDFCEDGVFKDEMISRIVLYIFDHYSEKISLEILAERFGYGKFTVSHAFKSKTGMDIRQYVNRVRLDEFIRLARADNFNGRRMKIIDAIYACGFESEQTFYRIFKKTFGITPALFIKSRKSD